MAQSSIRNVVGGQAVQSFSSKCVEVPWQHSLHQTPVHQTLETFTGPNILRDITVRQPVDHGSIIHHISAEKHLPISVM